MGERDTDAAARIGALIIAGGKGKRLGGASKSDLELGGRLLDRVLDSLSPLTSWGRVVIAPDSVSVPAGILRTMEDPPGGGPLAGLEAGLYTLLADQKIEGDSGGIVLVFSVDSPGVASLAPRLLRALDSDPEAEGAVILGGQPRVFHQYLQGAYRVNPLLRALDKGRGSSSSLHDRSVRSVLSRMKLVEVEAGAECRDLDTPEDLAWWRERLGEKTLREVKSRGESGDGENAERQPHCE